jgi:hypothetical protein
MRKEYCVAVSKRALSTSTRMPIGRYRLRINTPTPLDRSLEGAHKLGCRVAGAAPEDFLNKQVP